MSQPRLSAISMITLGSRQGSGLAISNFLSWLVYEALSKLLKVLQYSQGSKLPKRTFHLQAPLEESKATTTTLRSMNLSGLNSTYSSALHQPDYLSKYSFMMSSSRQNIQYPYAAYSRYFRAYSQRRLKLRGVFLSLQTPRTFFFLKPHILSRRNTTDRSIRAFMTGSIARSTSAISTWVRKGFSVKTSFSIVILPSVFDLDTTSQEVLVEGSYGLGFSGFLRRFGSYFHSLSILLTQTFLYYCAYSLSAFTFSSSMYSRFNFYICVSMMFILLFLYFLSRLLTLCDSIFFYWSTYSLRFSMSDGWMSTSLSISSKLIYQKSYRVSYRLGSIIGCI